MFLDEKFIPDWEMHVHKRINGSSSELKDLERFLKDSENNVEVLHCPECDTSFLSSRRHFSEYTKKEYCNGGCKEIGEVRYFHNHD